MTVCQTARYAVEPGGLDRALAAIRGFVDHVRANEPGTLTYLVWREVDEPTRFVHLIEFADEQAQQAHATSDAVDRFTGVLYPETVGGVEFTTYEMVAGK